MTTGKRDTQPPSGEPARRAYGSVTFLVFDAFSGGGVARTTANLAGELVRTRPVRVISLYRRRERAPFPLPDAVDVTVLWDRRRGRGRWGVLERLLARVPSRLRPAPSDRTMSLLTDLRLRRAIRDIRSGAVISTRPSLHLALTAFARPGVATIGWDHLNHRARSADARQTAVLRAAVPRLDAFVVLTHADAADYCRDLPDCSTRIEVIRNSVAWPNAERPPDLPEKVVVAAGRLVPRKGFGRLVKAFAPVAAAHPDWQLHIYGQGEQSDELEGLVRRLGLESQVRLQGYTHDLPAALRTASVYAMASRSEGFPMVLIEAMSVGLPLIAFDCPRGPGEIIRDGENGLLIENGRARAFSRGLLALVGDEGLRRRLGARALEDAESYTVATIAADWQRLLARVGADGSDEKPTEVGSAPSASLPQRGRTRTGVV